MEWPKDEHEVIDPNLSYFHVSESESCSSEGCECFQTYQFEPEYTEEEMEERRKYEAENPPPPTSAEKYAGRKGLINWCTCSVCQAMPSDVESMCCKEIKGIGAVMETNGCITLHPSFEAVVLDITHLNIMRHLTVMKTMNSAKKRYLSVPFGDLPNVRWQYLACKTFRKWIDSRLNLGEKKLYDVPSCVLAKIRERYPLVKKEAESSSGA